MFGTPRALIGVIHVAALPGMPAGQLPDQLPTAHTRHDDVGDHQIDRSAYLLE